MGAEKTIPVVIDTNVLVSALLFGGTPGKLVSLWQKGRIRPFLSKEIIAEIIRVLAYPKFELTQNEINYLLYVELLPYFEVTSYPDGPVIVGKDPQDDMFLKCAVAAGATAVISGDHYLLSLQHYKDIPILSPARFLQKFVNH
jgi:hypothetical protein